MKKVTILLSGILLSIGSFASTYTIPEDGSRIVGTPQTATAKKGDTLNRMAVRYGVGYNEILRANPKFKNRKIPSGTAVIIPTQHRLPNADRHGIVINLADMRLFYYPQGTNEVVTFPIAVGKNGWRTPKGRTSVVRKHRHPTWTPPASIHREAARRGKKLRRVYPAGPNNPLGTRALRLGISGYLIHGTNKPYSIGKRVSHGCIRLRRPDIERLFDLVSVDTPVTIVDQPSKNTTYSKLDTERLAAAAPVKYKRTTSTTKRKSVAKKTSVKTSKKRQSYRDESTEAVDYQSSRTFDYQRLQEDINNGTIKPINFSEM